MDELKVILDQLKSTVECLSMSAQTSTWEVCGGLDRLHSIMMNIFSHGCLTINSNVSKHLRACLGNLFKLNMYLTKIRCFFFI